mgnify:CR=1 FL=1
MTFRVEFTPEADAELDRLFDFLLERAETVEEAMQGQALHVDLQRVGCERHARLVQPCDVGAEVDVRDRRTQVQDLEVEAVDVGRVET